MSDNALKTHLSVALDALSRSRAIDMDQLEGKSLPVEITKIVSSNVVKVKFLIKGPFTLPEVAIPVASPQYGRIPYQVGDRGIAASIDFYQGGVSGFGGGTADYVQRANLTNLRFHGIGSKDLPTVDLDAHVLYGKNGVVLQDIDASGNKHTILTLTPDKIVIDLTNSTGKTLEIKGSTDITFDGNLRVKGNVTAGYGGGGARTLLGHKHTQPNDSHGDSEAETDPPSSG